ncbi:MAG: MerR family transcriptional regulator [Psychromonas sp.]
MNIQEFSKLTKLSAHTLRYYEKLGLLKQISRNESGHRDFSEKDRIWVEFVKRLKDTNMPLNVILHYSQLREQGVSTSLQRMEMLQQHAMQLQQKILNEQNHLNMLKIKIDDYSKSLLSLADLDAFIKK